MDGFSIIFWIALAVGGYAFYPPFRRWVNGLFVQLSDKVKHDADVPPPAAPDTHILEDVAMLMFEEDHPGDPRIAGGWTSLPVEIRKIYIQKAVESAARMTGANT